MHKSFKKTKRDGQATVPPPSSIISSCGGSIWIRMPSCTSYSGLSHQKLRNFEEYLEENGHHHLRMFETTALPCLPRKSTMLARIIPTRMPRQPLRKISNTLFIGCSPFGVLALVLLFSVVKAFRKRCA